MDIDEIASRLKARYELTESTQIEIAALHALATAEVAKQLESIANELAGIRART